MSVSTFWDCGFGIVSLRFGDEGFGNKAHGFGDWLRKSRGYLREAAQPCRIQCQARGSKAWVAKALVQSQPLNPDPWLIQYLPLIGVMIRDPNIQVLKEEGIY